VKQGVPRQFPVWHFALPAESSAAPFSLECCDAPPELPRLRVPPGLNGQTRLWQNENNNYESKNQEDSEGFHR